MARMLGDAFVVISPDTTGFRARADAGIRAAMSGLDPKVKVSADTSGVGAAVAGLQARLKALSGGKVGLADLIDLNVPQGQIIRQLLLLKRMVQQTGLSDMLGVNLNDAEIAAQLRKIAALSANVSVGADTSDAASAVADLRARLDALGGTLTDLRLGADDKQAEAVIAKLQAQLAALEGRVGKIIFQADTTKLDAQIATEEAKLARLQQQASDLVADANVAKAAAKIAGLEKQAADLYDRLDSLESDIDTEAALTKIYAIEAELRVLQGNAEAVKLNADSRALDAAVAASMAKVAALRQQAADVKLGASVDTAGLVSAEAGVTGLEAAVARLGAAGAATAATPIFTGAGWGGAILGISVWHIALDGALEAVIAVVSAMAALGAAAVAVYPAMDQLGYGLSHSLQAMTALGTDAGPLAGKLDALQRSVVPQVYEALGGALGIASNQASVLGRTAHDVVNMFDTWIAKIDIWMSTQRNLGGLLQSGAEYLAQFGKLFGILAQAIDNLLTKDPGVAHFLLDFLQGVAEAINLFSKLPGPVVEATLALHGLYLWTKVLVAAPLLFMAQALGILSAESALAAKNFLTFRGILGFFLTNPFGWALIAAAGLGLIAYQATQASNAAKAFINNIDTGLSQVSGGDAILQISSDIGKLRDQIEMTSPAMEMKNWSALGNTFRSVGYDARAFGGDMNQFSRDINPSLLTNFSSWVQLSRDAGAAIKDFFVPGGGAGRAATADIQAYTGEIVKLTGEQDNLFKVTGMLTSGYNKLGIGELSVNQAFALMTDAGVKASDSFQVMWQKVVNLISGYQAMSIQGGLLANTINAMNFATAQQDSKVSQVNSAWDTFFQTVTGGASGIVSFGQSLQTMQQQQNGTGQAAVNLARAQSQVSAAQVALTALQQRGTASSAQLTAAHQRLTAAQAGLALAATKAGGSMTGLDSASLTLRQDFLQAAGAANTQMSNLTLLASAAGLGAKGTTLLEQATKDMVAQMLPAAKGSAEMTSVLYALAQRGGYQGADSFKALATWVGNTKDPMANLDQITSQLTVDASNLTQDVKNLSIALGQNLNSAMAAAILQAGGGQKVFDDFATAVYKTSYNSQQQQSSAIALGDELIKLTGNTSDAHNEFDAFAQQMGMTRKQADDLWSEITAKLSPAINDQANSALPGVQKAFTTFAQVGLQETQKQADSLWSQITGKLGPDMGKLGDLASGPAKQKFLDWAENGLKLTQNQAMDLWREVDTLQQHINALHGKDVSVGVTASASGVIDIQGSGWAAGQGNIRFHAASGAYVDAGTGPTSDDVLAWVSRGELIVPANMVAAGAVDNLRGKIPGFAGGGFVDQAGAVAGIGAVLSGISGQAGSYTGSDSAEAVRAGVSEAIAAAKKTIQKASAAAAPNPAGSGVARWIPTVETVLKLLGLSNEQFALLTVLSQMTTESGGDPTIVNKWDSNWAAGHPCLTLDCMILTRRGWLNWEDVRTGDETLGYNPQTQRSEWTRITHVHYYEDAEVWRIGNKHWHADVTPNHRWWSDTRTVLSPESLTACPECGWAGRTDRPGLPPASPRSISTHRGRMHGVRDAPVTASRGEFVVTRDLGHGHRIRLAAPADTDGIPGLSLEDVRVIAWLQGDGHLSRAYRQPVLAACPECGWLPGHRKPSRGPLKPEHVPNSIAVHRARVHGVSGGGNNPSRETADAGWDGSIYQSKPAQVVKLRALLADVPHTEHIRERGGNTMPAHQFKLHREYVTDLMKRSRLPETGPEAFVLALSPDQRGAWLDSMIDAEGHRQPIRLAEGGKRRGAGGEFVRIAQVDGPLQDAIKLAVYLEGYRPTFSPLSAKSRGYQPSGHVGMARSHIAPSMFSPHQVLERQPVWCVTTELGTWTAEQDGLPFLTGNSVGLMQVIGPTFAAYAGPFRNTGPFEYGVSTNGEANIYAGLNYAIHAYGNPGWLSVLGHGHGYALGGLVPGYAGGGSVSATRNMLNKAQAGERAKYYGLTHSLAMDLASARPGSYTSSHRTSIRNEMKTLAARQSAELSAYARLGGSGLTAANLSKLASAARAETRTASDLALTHVHPLWAKDLRGYLATLEGIQAPAGGAGGGSGGMPSKAALIAAQAGEKAKYFGLTHSIAMDLTSAKPGSYTASHRKTITSELATLAKRQAKELSEWSALNTAKFSTAAWSKLASAARSEITTASDQALTRVHPLWASDLRKYLGILASTATSGSGGGSGGASHPNNPPWVPGNLGPVHTVGGGVLQFDTGRGVLPPGLSLTWNGTGRPEALSANGTGGGHGNVTIVVENHGVIGSRAETEVWLKNSLDRMARTGKLTQAVKRALG